MAEEIKNGPTIGERVVSTVVQGVKQGIVGGLVGAAGGAAFQAASQVAGEMAASDGIKAAIDVANAAEINQVAVAETAIKAGAAGAAIGATHGAVQGLGGSREKWAERVAAKGTEQGFKNMMQQAIEEQQVNFAQALEQERAAAKLQTPAGHSKA